MKHGHAVFLTAVSSLALLSPRGGAAEAAVVTPLAQTGQLTPAGQEFAPGIGTMPSQQRLVSTSSPAVNVFWAPVLDEDHNPRGGLFAHSAGGGLTQLGRRGAQAPGLEAGIQYNDFSLPILSRNGSFVAFQGELEGPGVVPANALAAFAGPLGAPICVLRNGAQAPGLPAGINYWSGFPPVVNNAGQMLIDGELAGAGITDDNKKVLYTGNIGGGPLQVLARAGDPAPGMPAGVTYGYPVLPHQNDAGIIAFGSQLTGPGTNPIDEAFFVGPVGAVAPITRTGDHAPGLPASFTFSYMDYIRINNAGKLLYQAELAGPGVDATNDYGLWAVPVGGPTKLVVRDGDPAPGMPSGTIFTSFDFHFSDSGKVAINASVGGSGITTDNDRGVWIGDEDGLELIAQEGSPAPGLPGQSFHSLERMGMSDDGNVAFFATYGAGGAGSGVWVTDDAGTLRKLIASGDNVDINGVGRTVAGMVFEGQNIPEQMVFDSSDRLYLRLSFTDGGEGVYAVQLPEPASLPAMALACLLYLRRRRRFLR